MANDLSNPVQANPASDDSFFEHGAGQDSLFSTVQLAQNGTAAPAAPGQTIHVNPPQGEAGPVVIRIEVTPGSIVELPQPFEADATLMAREGDGNLAIKVGDVTVILQGYVDANQEAPVTIEGADNQPIDIATILASTDPTIDIQTAAGPDAGQNGQGADNTGAILAQLDEGNGLGGFEGAGAQDGTELGYRTIDNSIRNDFADTLVTADVFGFSIGGRSGVLGESSLRDPAQTQPFHNNSGTYFGDFLQGYRDAVEHPGQAMFAGWADFHGTAVTQNNDFDEYLSQTTQTTTVNVNFTGGTGDLVLTNLGNQITSNGSHVSFEITDGGHTMFLRRDEATAGDKGNALIAVVHVEGPDASGNFTIETFLVNRIDHDGKGEGDAGKDTMNLDIKFTVYDGPAPQEGGSGEGGDLPPQPSSPAMEGKVTASFDDDVPILEKVTYNNQHDGSMAARSEASESVGGSSVGLIDEDWLKGGAHDTGADGKSNAGVDGDTGGGTCVTGSIVVNFGADGAANADGATEQKKNDPDKHAFALNIATYVLGKEFPYGANGLSSGGVTLKVLSVGPDHVTVGIADEKQQRVEGDTSEQPTGPTDPIPGCTIFTLTLDQTTGAFKFELKGPLDHGDSIFANNDGVSALVAEQPENTIPLQFGVTARDDDGDTVQAKIDIDVNDDVPVARSDKDTVAEGSHDAIMGNVMDGTGTDSGNAGKDSQGADHAHVVGVWAGTTSGGENDKVSQSIDGQYGKLTLNADGSYTYTRNAYSDGGVDDVFTYTLKDGDGDKSTATLTIHIDDAGVTVALPTSPADTTVYEAGLPDGSNAAANSEHTAGTITITAKDGIETLEIEGQTLTLAELKGLGAQHLEISDSDGTLTLTGFDEATGKLTYTYDLTDNNSANSVKTVEFDIKVTDVDGDTGTAKLAIDIVDDTPTAVGDELKLNAPKEATADVQFVLDISGSMKDQYANVPGNTYPDNRIGLERYAVEQMLNAHPEIQNVQIVLFDDHASHSDWMTRDEALAWIKEGSNFNGQGGNTNFDEALTEAMEGFVEIRPLTHGDQTLVYFFSDGNPNEPRDEGITGVGANDPKNVSVKEWTDFVNAHDISNVFGVGIPGIAGHLAPIAYPDGAGNSEPNQIGLAGSSNSQLGDLLDTLTDTIVTVVTPIHGNVTTNDVPGADGFGDGKLTQVSYNGTDYTFDSTTHEHTIDLGAGRGTLVIKDDGSYDYTPPAKNADGNAFYVQYTMQDGDGDTSNALLKIDINTRPVTDLNGAGQGADNAAHFVEDDGAVRIAPNATVSDDGVLLHSMTVTLTNRPDGDATEGLSLNAVAQDAADTYGITWTYSNGVLTLSRPDGAPVSAYQFILQNIVYNNSSQAPNETDRHITVVVNDGTSDSVSHAIEVCVTSVNDAPDANIFQDPYSTSEDQVLTLSGAGKMSISDVDAGNEDVTVTLSVTQGIIDVTKGNSGVTVTNDETSSVKLTGTVAEINALLHGTGNNGSGKITYLNTNDSPQAQVTLTLKVDDKGESGIGGAKTDTDTATINVANVNDKPVTDLNGGSYGSDHEVFFQEDQGAIAIAPSATITDDTGKLLSMTVGLASRPDGALETLSLNSAAETARVNAGLSISNVNGVITISSATPVDASVYQTILRGIVYNNDSNTPNTNDRTVTVTVKDEGNLVSTSHTISVDVDPTNDTPTANAPASTMTVDEQTDLTISGKGFSINDVDAGNDQVKVTLTVVEGKLTVTAGNSGIDWVDNNGTGTVTVYGSQSEINALLAGNGLSGAGKIVYRDDTDTPADTTKLTLTVNDQNNNGEGGAKSASVFTIIDLNNTSEKPVTDLNGSSNGSDNSASYTEDASPVKIAPSGKITDVDSANLSSMTVTLTNIKDGALESLGLNSTAQSLATGLGLTITAYNPVSGVLTISGPATVANYQSILQGIVYDNDSQNPNTTTRSVTVVVNDGSSDSVSHAVSISVTPVNDAPDAIMTKSTYAAVEEVSLTLSGSGMKIEDIDANNGKMTVWLKVGEGQIDINAGTTGVTLDDNHSGNVEITGTLTQINNLLAGTGGDIKYYNDDDTPSASTTLKLTVNDEGYTGGGDLTDYATATITIQDTNENPAACDDQVYTNAGAAGFNISEWILLNNDSDADTASSKFDFISGNAAITNIVGATVPHTDGTGSAGFVTFTDTNGNTDSKFDYTMTDGSGGTAIGHVTVHQDTNGGSLTASSGDDIVIAGPLIATTADGGAGDDIVVGSQKDDKLDGGADDDLIFGGGGNDSLVYSSDSNSSHDQYDGGTGFDRLQVTGSGNVNIDYVAAQFKDIEMIDLNDATNRSGSGNQNEFALNAADLGVHNYGTVGSGGSAKQISLFVIGDESGNSSGKDIVDLHGFTATSTTGSFTDPSGTHNFTVYTGMNSLSQTVNVAVETGLIVHTS